MTLDDPRHGTYAGAQAHLRDGEDLCPPCERERYATKKRHSLERLQGVRMFYTADELAEVMKPWLDMGMRPSAISYAAGFRDQKGSTICDILRGGSTRVRRATYHAFARVTEDSFDGKAKVDGDLTRRRIYSLMAAGHLLVDMPINPRGQWRNRRCISVATARAIRDYYEATEHTEGTSAHTASRARRAGHLPPAGWDDPGTLGWPGPTPDPCDLEEQRWVKWWTSRGYADVDEAVVLRLLAGERIPASKAERSEAMRRWLSWGRSELSLCEIHGWKDGRYVAREDGAA